MSWFDRARAALAALALARSRGCFQPLYGEAAHPGLVEAMREIEVAPIKERIGHYLADDLITNLNGTGETPKAKYRLTITVAQNDETPTIESQINVASSATVIGNATFTLTKIDGGAVIYKGDGDVRGRLRPHLDSFADLRAARDAEIRIARSLADEIELRVAAALGRRRR